MKFSIIIPTYNDWHRLKKCLTALENQVLASDQYEVIVVNNDTEAIPDDFHIPEGMQLIQEPEPGSYIARNTGVAVAKGDILAFTDSDCIPATNWLTSTKNYFQHTNCDLLGGKVEIFKDEDGDRYGFLYERFTAFPQHLNVPLGRGVTANLFVKKSVFNQLNGFDAKVKSGGDWDFTQRCTDAGFNMIYGEDVLVLHPARNLSTIFKKYYRVTCGGALNVKRRFGHSYWRIMGSHFLRGLKLKRTYLTEPSRSEKLLVWSIDVLKYFYRIAIHGGLILGLIDPNKVRE